MRAIAFIKSDLPEYTWEFTSQRDRVKFSAQIQSAAHKAGIKVRQESNNYLDGTHLDGTHQDDIKFKYVYKVTK